MILLKSILESKWLEINKKLVLLILVPNQK
jgi:hypothetical protein